MIIERRPLASVMKQRYNKRIILLLGVNRLASDAKKKANKRYNQKTYDRPPVSIRKEILTEFAATCKRLGVSQASVITDAMQDFINRHNTGNTKE